MTPSPATPRVVAAVTRDVQSRIRAILPDWELRFVETGAELARALDEERCAMVIVGMHFDESNAVAALQRVLSREETFPLVCVRGQSHIRLGEPALGAVRMALGELGAQNFIDLLQYPNDEGGNARVRAMLERLISRE